jgi:hypothetical protein
VEDEAQSRKKGRGSAHSSAAGADPVAQARCARCLSRSLRASAPAHPLLRLTDRRYDTLQRKHKDVLSENETLRVRIQELETHFAQYKRSTGPDDMVIVNSSASSAETGANRTQCTASLLVSDSIIACLQRGRPARRPCSSHRRTR